MFVPGKNIVPITATFTALSLVSCDYAADYAEKTPNVVFIHIDDLGWTDLGYMGSKFYETPNIDNLAATGLVFTNAYASAANCAPSRACLLTGMNTPKHGIYTVNPADRGNPRTRQLIAAENADSIMPHHYTLGHLFSDNGYKTCAIGKWHLSSDPRNNGFHINIGGDTRGNPGQGGYFAPYNITNIEQGPDGEYLTDRLTDEAISFIRENKEQPFFLYMSYYTVHTPLMGKEHLVEKYRQKEYDENHHHPVYAAMIESMDKNVGRILKSLKDYGLEANTIVVFISDNGGIRAISAQDPLRAGKGSYYEGGIRVPLIMKWPEHIETGVTDEPVINFDFFPTFMSVLNVEPEEKTLDGTDLSPLFSKGGSLERRPLFWHFPIYLQRYGGALDQSRDPLFRTRPGSVVRYGEWKLHEYFEDGALELYNLETDLGETTNLANTHPEATYKLYNMLIAWRDEVNAPVPDQRNPRYDPDFEQKRIQNLLGDNTIVIPADNANAFRQWFAGFSYEHQYTGKEQMEDY